MPCLEAPLDIVFFLLDDMRSDQVEHLTETLERLSPEAVVFDRAYVTTPMCCPVRASLLSGGYLPSQTGVLTNSSPNGGATQFLDGDTLATRMQAAGYRTVLLGKYLNDYDLLGDYVPPGWTWFAGTGIGAWTDFHPRSGSSTPDASGVATAELVHTYVTEWQTTEALEVLEGEGPLFLYMSYLAPHDPHVPAAGDDGSFEGYTYRGRGYAEADVSDKPDWIQDLALPDAATEAAEDIANRERLQSLLAVDRSMAAIIDAVRAAGRAEQTLFVVASDNGQLWGEHRIYGKGVAYEESVGVPLLMAHPALSPRHTSALVAVNLDLAATFTELAALPAEGEGQSLVPLACGAEVLRTVIPLQGWPAGQPAWMGLVTDTRKYIETWGGDVELYDLVSDPYELDNLQSDRADEVAGLAAVLDATRGLVGLTETLPTAQVGEDYRAELSHWGGVGSIVWSADELPPGLSADPAGAIVGTPTEPGTWSVGLTVTDGGASPVHGGPERWRANVILQVAPEPAPGCGCGGGSAGILPLGLLVGWRRRAATSRRCRRVESQGGASAPPPDTPVTPPTIPTL